MTQRIHVVGSSPRTGTTLMVELMISSYRIEGQAAHEMSIFEPPPSDSEVFCSKLPADLLNVGPLLRFDRRLWVINMIRDPRDVVVSRHAKAPDQYWIHLGVWKRRRRAAIRLADHPQVMTVRYEDLVQNPAAVQQRIEQWLPFLERTGDFVDFHRNATPSSRAVLALGGLRPIETSSIGNWRRHKPRLAAQLLAHGSIDQDLIDFGYERDGTWGQELQGVTPDNGASYFPERTPTSPRVRETLTRTRRIGAYIWRSVAQRSNSGLGGRMGT